jgi:phage gp36-like protein
MYASLDDFKKRLNRHYQDLYLDADGNYDESLMTGDLTDAAAEVDAYLASRYAVPVTEPEALPMLRGCQLALAAALAWGRADADELPEKVKDAAKVARGQLKDIAKGDIVLPAAPAQSTSGAGGAAIVQAETPVFGRSNMGGF